jgi:hypothetical protein
MMDAKRYVFVMAIALLVVLFARVLVSCGALDWGGGVKIKPEGKPFIGTPSETTVPEQAIAGVPVVIAVEYYETYTLKLIDVKTSLNEAAYEFVIELWFQRYYVSGGSVPAIAFICTERITVTFPKPGNWTIRSGELSVPVTVLPAED